MSCCNLKRAGSDQQSMDPDEDHRGDSLGVEKDEEGNDAKDDDGNWVTDKDDEDDDSDWDDVGATTDDDLDDEDTDFGTDDDGDDDEEEEE